MWIQDENCYTDKKTRQFRQCTWNTLSDRWLVSQGPGRGHKIQVQMKIVTLIRKHVSSDNAFGIHYQTDGWYLRDQDVGPRYISSDENCYTDKKTRQFRQCIWNTLSDRWLVSQGPGCGYKIQVQMKIVTLIRKHVS